MYSYALAFGILGTGVLLALVLCAVPHLRRRGQVRRFRKDLDHVDLVALDWSERLRQDQPFEDRPVPVPEGRRRRRHRQG